MLLGNSIIMLPTQRFLCKKKSLSPWYFIVNKITRPSILLSSINFCQYQSIRWSNFPWVQPFKIKRQTNLLYKCHGMTLISENYMRKPQKPSKPINCKNVRSFSQRKFIQIPFMGLFWRNQNWMNSFVFFCYIYNSSNDWFIWKLNM